MWIVLTDDIGLQVIDCFPVDDGAQVGSPWAVNAFESKPQAQAYIASLSGYTLKPFEDRTDDLEIARDAKQLELNANYTAFLAGTVSVFDAGGTVRRMRAAEDAQQNYLKALAVATALAGRPATASIPVGCFDADSNDLTGPATAIVDLLLQYAAVVSGPLTTYLKISGQIASATSRAALDAISIALS